MKDIYKLDLHETIKIDSLQCYIIRVPGGWIYEQYANKVTIFVPFNEEFMR